MVTYNEIVENEFILSKDGLKWIEFNKSIRVLREKYPNILDDFKSIDGFAFPSSDYVTRFANLKKKVRLVQISNVNQNEWIIIDSQKFEYVPDKYLLNRKKYLLNDECILISLTGGSDTDNDISSYFENSFQAFLNQRVSAFTMKKYDKDYFFYFYALTKTKSFKEQWLGKGGVQKNTVASDRAKTYLPKIDNLDVVKFVSVLTQAIINKEKIIKTKHETILKTIESELLENQKPNEFSFDLPRLNELENIGRLDTGMYCAEYKKLKFSITNYSNGSQRFLELNNKKVSITRGQNLQESNIGKSIYIDKYKKGFYRLCLSKQFTNYQTITDFSFLGNTSELKAIKKGEIIFSCRGDMGRSIVFCEDVNNTITNIDNVHICFENQELYKNIFISQFLNFIKLKGYLSKIAITGSGADSFTKYQFELLDIPNFPESTQKLISKLYHNNEIEYNADAFSLDNFLEQDTNYNKNAGIYELDKTAKQLKEILDLTILKICLDSDVDIKFTI